MASVPESSLIFQRLDSSLEYLEAFSIVVVVGRKSRRSKFSQSDRLRLRESAESRSTR